MARAKRKRIGSIDTLRGLAVCLMVIHHFLYDLVWLLGAPGWLFSNPVFDFLHYLFAGTFIFLSGVSSRFSRSNVRRGLIVFGIALAMSVVTMLPIVNNPIRFGVLHLLGVCMALFGATQPYIDRIPRRWQWLLFVFLFFLSMWAIRNVNVGEYAYIIWPLGWTYPGFHSSDWFPLFPWMFVFLLGTWAGLYVVERSLPKRVYTFTIPPLASVGRVSLWVYVLHQPVLYGIVMLIKLISGK